ncbi:zinc metalloproteinase nas-39-like [Gigantopelta aegis]|uniref:zinc metalloproteinase nas-39-like n=1 Tax=Gigantopelta aegis TaxID=1735272 RepID=UPI001B88E4DE|nr:zinc metalloproteinase nas-39-like [Gigantopelta aegis]
MDKNCNNDLLMKDSGSGFLELTSSSRYDNNMDCFLVLTAPPNQRMLVRLLKLNLHSGLDPCSDWMQLFDGGSPLDTELTGHLCGDTIPGESYASTGQTITVVFTSDHADNDGGFMLLFTTFSMGNL